MRSNSIAGFGIAVAAVGALVGGAILDASGGALSQEEESAVYAELVRFGTPPATATALVAKLDVDEPWQSWSGDPATGERSIVVDGVSYSVATWDDGSFFASTIATMPGSGGGQSIGSGISSCDEGLGAGRFPYFNCRIAFSGGVYGGEFSADFTLSNISVPATIERVWGATYFAVAGVVTGDGQSPPVRVVIPEADTAPAMAELTFLYGSTGDVAGSSAAIRLNVDGMDAWVTSP